MATVALQNRLPEDIVDMSDEKRAEIQLKICKKEFEELLKRILKNKRRIY